MKFRPLLMFVMPLAFGSIAFAQPPAKSTIVLDKLALDFKAARALPAGARPAPPVYDLDKLVGMKWASVHGALGPPDPSTDFDWECHARKCEIYSYGANELQSDKVETGDAGNGLQWIAVTTGGPTVLVLGVSSDRIVSARWQGQK